MIRKEELFERIEDLLNKSLEVFELSRDVSMNSQKVERTDLEGYFAIYNSSREIISLAKLYLDKFGPDDEIENVKNKFDGLSDRYRNYIIRKIIP